MGFESTGEVRSLRRTQRKEMQRPGTYFKSKKIAPNVNTIDKSWDEAQKILVGFVSSGCL